MTRVVQVYSSSAYFSIIRVIRTGMSAKPFWRYHAACNFGCLTKGIHLSLYIFWSMPCHLVVSWMQLHQLSFSMPSMSAKIRTVERLRQRSWLKEWVQRSYIFSRPHDVLWPSAVASWKLERVSQTNTPRSTTSSLTKQVPFSWKFECLDESLSRSVCCHYRRTISMPELIHISVDLVRLVWNTFYGGSTAL